MKIELESGCVTVRFDDTPVPQRGPTTYHIEVRGQVGDGITQTLTLTTEMAVTRLIEALSKIKAARDVLAQL